MNVFKRRLRSLPQPALPVIHPFVTHHVVTVHMMVPHMVTHDHAVVHPPMTMVHRARVGGLRSGSD